MVVSTERPPNPGHVPSVSAPQNLKEWIASILAAERRQELFDNYASPREKRRFRKESFDEFVGRLTDEVTLVS